MDHGVSVGPIGGLQDMRSTVARIVKAEADAILVHAGIARTVDTNGLGLIVHLSGATRLSSEPNWKARLTSVRDAVRLGADAVSVHINVGSNHEQAMLENFALISEECNDYGMPTLAMMYPRGPAITDEHAFDAVSHAVRLGYEIGADIVQTNFTGDVDSFSRVIQSVQVPVIIAGGPRAETDAKVLQMIHDSIRAGAKGVSIGRNVFQHENPAAMILAISGVVHNGLPAEEAAKLLEGSEKRRTQTERSILAP